MLIKNINLSVINNSYERYIIPNHWQEITFRSRLVNVFLIITMLIKNINLSVNNVSYERYKETVSYNEDVCKKLV